MDETTLQYLALAIVLALFCIASWMVSRRIDRENAQAAEEKRIKDELWLAGRKARSDAYLRALGIQPVPPRDDQEADALRQHYIEAGK